MSEISERSFCASAANRCRTNGSTSLPSSATMNGTLCIISPEIGEHREDQVGLPGLVSLGGVKLVYVLPRDRRHLQLPEFRPQVALHNLFHRILGAWLVLPFHVLGDVPVISSPSIC